MNRLTAVLFAVAGAASAATPDAGPDQPVNLLSPGAGGLLVEEPPSYAKDPSSWSPFRLVDEDPATGWATSSGDLSPKSFVFELAERSQITRLAFNTLHTETAERSAKEVRVEIADSKDGPYSPVANLSLEKQRDGQSFPLQTPATGRYVKLTALSNWGDKQYNEIMDFAAYGKPLTHTPLADNTGAFSSSYGTFRLQQSGSTAAGCYEYKYGLIENGGFEGRVLRFTWREGQPGQYTQGPAIMIFSQDGQSFTGYWGFEGQGISGSWNGKRTSKDVGACPHWKPNGNAVTQELASEGRARIYGILFDTDSDRLKDESRPALEQLVATAKEQPGWKFMIEGHTDNTGGDAHNQALSEKRAAAVKDYLVKASVDAARLSSAGFGASKPVAGNDTALGRSQNRRVEIVKQ